MGGSLLIRIHTLLSNIPKENLAFTKCFKVAHFRLAFFRRQVRRLDNIQAPAPWIQTYLSNETGCYHGTTRFGKSFASLLDHIGE